jgi:hypothetical protein
MAVSRNNKVQRTTDGNYLGTDGSWYSSGNSKIRKIANRADVGAIVQSKQSGIYRKVKTYDVT